MKFKWIYTELFVIGIISCCISCNNCYIENDGAVLSTKCWQILFATDNLQTIVQTLGIRCSTDSGSMQKLIKLYNWEPKARWYHYPRPTRQRRGRLAAVSNKRSPERGRLCKIIVLVNITHSPLSGARTAHSLLPRPPLTRRTGIVIPPSLRLSEYAFWKCFYSCRFLRPILRKEISQIAVD